MPGPTLPEFLERGEEGVAEERIAGAERGPTRARSSPATPEAILAMISDSRSAMPLSWVSRCEMN